MIIHNSKQSLSILKQKLDSSKRVFFTRFGDNDLMMMSNQNAHGNPLGNRPYGGNQTVWSENLQKDLIKAFQIKSDNYLKGLSVTWDNEPGMRQGCFAPFGYNRRLESMASKYTDERTFLLPVLFHYLFCFKPDVFNQFVKDYIKGRKVMYIGSTSKRDAEKIIGPIHTYISTPPKGAYIRMNDIWNNVRRLVDDVASPSIKHT